jgi:hypothetical protein
LRFGLIKEEDMAHRSWMIIAALFFGLAQAKADDSAPPWLEDPAQARLIPSDAQHLAEMLRLGGPVELDVGLRLIARKVVNDRFIEVAIERRIAKGQLVWTARAAGADITVDHRAATASIRLRDGDANTADGASKVIFTEKTIVIHVLPALIRNLEDK